MNDDYVKKTISVYDKKAEYYAKKLDDYAPRPEQEKFVKLLPKNARVLDAGCGPGRDCEYFTKLGFSVTGVDLSENLLSIARKRVPGAIFKNQDLRKLRFQREFFDGIWACASLLHLKRKDMPGVLRSFFRILKSNGVLFVQLKEGKGEADIIDPIIANLSRHYVYYSLPELKKILEETGFVIKDIYTWNEEVRRPGRRDLVWISSFSKKPEGNTY